MGSNGGRGVYAWRVSSRNPDAKRVWEEEVQKGSNVYVWRVLTVKRDVRARTFMDGKEGRRESAVYVWRGGQVRGRGPQVGEVGVTRAGLVRVARVQLGACVARPQRAVPLVRLQGTAPGFASPGPVRSR
jgi:hypothetical protein